MRAALSILGLVVAFAVVMFVMKKQVTALAPKAAGMASSAPASAPQNQPEAVRQQLQQSMEQAAARASDAQP